MTSKTVVHVRHYGRLALTWESAEIEATRSVAWGDWDSDGDLDLAVGNDGQPNRVYENTGVGLTPAWSSTEVDDTTSVAWGVWTTIWSSNPIVAIRCSPLEWIT